MAAPQPTLAIVPSSPSMPSLAKTEPPLVTYLQTFALWMTQRLQERTPVNQASPFFLLAASDAAPGTTPKVFKITVDSAGALHATVMTLGAGP